MGRRNDLAHYCSNFSKNGGQSERGGTIMRSAIPENAIPGNCEPHQKSTELRSEMY